MLTITYREIRAGMDHSPYPMELVGEDEQALVNAVNQGIDSRLEACNCPSRGDKFEHVHTFLGGTNGAKKIILVTKLHCTLSTESLPTLLRRLMESEDEHGENLATAILDTLGFETDSEMVEIVAPCDE